MRILALFACIFFGASSAAAQEIGFKGVPLGATKSDLLEKFPFLDCKPPPGRSFASLGEELCSVPMSASFEQTRPLYSYGGQPAMDAQFAIVGGRVEQFSIRFLPDRYEAIKAAISEAYGDPKETTSIRQTMRGEALASRRLSVSRSNGTLSVLEHAGRVDQGAVDGRSSAFEAYVDRVKKGDPKAGSKDL